MKQIGEFSETVINTLKLNITPGTPIFIGESNETHIKNKHPYEYDKYYDKISNIISHPDYIGLSPKDNSVQYVKLFQHNSEYIRVSVRVSNSGNHYAKTLHLLSTYNAERYINKGTLIKLDNT